MDLDKIFGKREQIENWKKPLVVTLVLLAALDFFIPREHAVFIWEKIGGFTAVYGFISTVLITIFSKFIGHIWLMKPEDYYD
ncbi:MAG: hypothetical protein WAO55_04985 [Candidatus Manganitrophaceae bacterium]